MEDEKIDFLNLLKPQSPVETANNLTPTLRKWRRECTNKNTQEKLRPIVPEVINTIKNLSEVHDSSLSEIMKVATTFLSNFLTQNEENQSLVWSLAFPHLFISIMEFYKHVESKEDNHELLSFLCMLMYNGSCGSIERSKSFLTDEGMVLVVDLLEMISKETSDDAFEWIHLFIKNLLKFWPALYEKIETEAFSASKNQVLLLNFVDITLEKEDCDFITHDSAQHLVSKLKAYHQSILNEDKLSPSQSTLTRQALPHIVSILGAYSSVSTTEFNTILFTEDIVKILIDWCSLDTKTDNHKPEASYKSFSMQIISNITYNNERFQDLIRELGGLPIIMNCCISDNINPFLREWSIFALRNLCLENQKNQDEVNQFKAQGIPDDVKEKMEKRGIKLSIGEGGKIKFEKIKDK